MKYELSFFRNSERHIIATFDDINGVLTFAAGFATAIAMTDDSNAQWVMNDENDNRQWLSENNAVCVAYTKRDMSVLKNSVFITISK